MMHGREKSDSAIVAEKPTNKVVSATAEPVEPRASQAEQIGKARKPPATAVRRGDPQCRVCAMAVGNRVTLVPPPRTGRAAFPHPAPTSDSDGKTLRPSVRAPASVTRFPGSVSGACVAGSRSPRPPPFAPSPPLPVPRFCSATSSLL